jgi:hypothetical protein
VPNRSTEWCADGEQGVTTAVGRCVTCGYAHQYDELKMDVDREGETLFFFF